MNNINQRKIRVGSILFILAPLIFFLCEAIAASAWTSPPYHYYYNFISDLGIPVVTEFQGRMINSPLHNVMNLGFISYAVMFILAYSMIIHMLPEKGKKIDVVLAMFHGIGVALVGFFPGYDWWGVIFHGIGAVGVIFGGNLAILSTGLLVQRAIPEKWFAVVSVVFGIIGIIGIIICIAVNDYQGVFERISIYPIMAWDIIFGVLMCKSSYKSRERLREI